MSNPGKITPLFGKYDDYWTEHEKYDLKKKKNEKKEAHFLKLQ